MAAVQLPTASLNLNTYKFYYKYLKDRPVYANKQKYKDIMAQALHQMAVIRLAFELEPAKMADQECVYDR